MFAHALGFYLQHWKLTKMGTLGITGTPWALYPTNTPPSQSVSHLFNRYVYVRWLGLSRGKNLNSQV